MYVTKIPNRKSPPAILLRESYREGGKVKTRTLSNLSHLPNDLVDLVRRSLKGEKFVSVDDAFERVESWHHGHVSSVLQAMKRLGFEQLISSQRSRERDLVVAMTVGRILEPDSNKNSKLANTRWWEITTLPQLLDVTCATEDELYDAMDWVLERQEQIERRLSDRHLVNGGQVLYDMSSSYFEGVTCPLAAFGHNRDGKRGKLQVNYGLLTDKRGCPVAVSVFEGNKSDSKTVMFQVEKIRERFGIEKAVLVGDRGMISQKLIDESLRETEGVDWITALKSSSIRKLIDSQHIQPGLFDEYNLFELTVSGFPGERLVACRNPELAKLRGHKRDSLLEATAKELEKARLTVERGKLRGEENIARRVQAVVKKYKVATHFEFTFRDDGFDLFVVPQKKLSKTILNKVDRELKKIRLSINQGRYGGKDQIGVRVGKVINKYKVAKHFSVSIREDGFEFHVNKEEVVAEASLDGVYVVRSSVSADQLSTGDLVRNYKSLSQVERAFGSLKTIDLKIRPIRHRLETRVRAHIFLCMLAYYVEWHMREAWRELIFADEEQEAKQMRDPVAPAKRSPQAMRKVHKKTLEDGSTVHSFQSLLKLLSQIVWNKSRIGGADSNAPTVDIITTPTSKQKRAFDLINTIKI